MTAPLATSIAAARRLPAPADLLALAKPRIVALVCVTTAAGYALGLRAVPVGGYPATSFAATAWVLFHTVLGTALVAAGASAFNQVVERDVDARMRRTARRPLPDGRLTPREAATFAWAVAALGMLELLWLVNAPTALLAALTLVVYVHAYTPLKRRTHVAALVGAVPGALPVVGGWTAAGAALDARAATLLAILFLWQLPHVLALGWMYRDDYARAGLHTPGVDDVTGAATFRRAALASAALLPVSLAPAVLGLAGRTYFVAALALSWGLLRLARRAARAPAAATARRLFLATLAYLPLLLAFLVAPLP